MAKGIPPDPSRLPCFLTPPPKVERRVRRLYRNDQLSDSLLREYIFKATLAHYFVGEWALYRITCQGLEVLVYGEGVTGARRYGDPG